MNRFTCISNAKFSLNERRLVWGVDAPSGDYAKKTVAIPDNAPDTPSPARQDLDRKRSDAEHMNDKNGKSIDKGGAEMRTTLTKEERRFLAESNKEGAKNTAWERTHPDPLKEPGEKIGQMTKEEVGAKIEGLSFRNRWEPMTERAATILFAKMLKADMDPSAFDLIVDGLEGAASERKLDAKASKDANMKKMADMDVKKIGTFVAKLTKRSEERLASSQE